MPPRPSAGTIGTLSARVLVRVANFASTRGHDPESVCRAVGLSLATLHDPEARVPYSVAEQLGHHVATITRDANFGLHLAQDVRDARIYDAGALMLMASPSIRVGFERLTRFQRFWGDGERCVLYPADEGLILRYELPGVATRPRRHADECALAEMVIGVRVLSAQDLSPRAVRFRHDAPDDIREHRELFRCAIEFGAEHTEIEFDDAVLDASMRDANDAYSAIFVEQVERALARLPPETRTSASVRAAARAALSSGHCTGSGTARSLGLSVRTMQRRLRADGTSFEEIIDALRREMALACLDKELTVPEIAWLLGYADASAFHHAFKRWTGRSPEQVRSARGTS